MYVSDLALTDFRSYADLVIGLEPGITAFVGPNGQGKTNLVEAIGYLGTFSSHRVSGDAALVRWGAERAVVRAKVVRRARPTLVELEIVAGRANRARVDRSPVSRVREAAGIARSVIFAPEDLALVKGDPDGRRRFLDDLLVQLSPRLAGVRSEYERVLRQRTALLKSAGPARRRSGDGEPAALRTLDVWDGHLARAGAELVAARVRLVQDLRPHVGATYEQVSAAQSEARISYRASVEEARPDDAPTEVVESVETELTRADLVEARLLEAMARLRTREIERGVSLVGPHRDDLVLTLADMPAKGYASHGESWSYALALRLASYALLRDDGEAGGGGEPVLVLDDVFAELDARRRTRLASIVASAEQVLVTAAVAEDVPEELEGARMDVMGGEVLRVR
ncbi:DNA replication and repair protein RecF [Beutenbergia cavernae DSM 12333]|uniref:DNA replication and repair protein RecF n=1 Tax=Beutenbergia cavernae (strain ATCC BAA-8 / DSM 12333 / CCUG 43141 / JCM 11478 / NBRC 16432 / NCIMB 13614 / HKI 0122) TaxID=471853 RepID=RECF_BEUC1|nr:DNA replication/repair protein RecF [Beutenbergia cavernae]C5BUP6.1 RecName: Full=DNA replication and repair protein RecF [Beutenbergia cavernae DSM 12333]ACQ78270.1 DNA replication and repair protein RecF [Beutenbergia cavernae DSM 12333]